MKLVTMALAATLLLVGGSAVAAAAVGHDGTDGSSPVRDRVAARMHEQGGDSEGSGSAGDSERGGMLESQRELQRRTMEQLGITPQELAEARIAAIESMVDDGLLDEQRAQRRIERIREASSCIEDGGDLRDCLGQGRGGGRS